MGGVLDNIRENSALAELGGAAGGLQAVLLKAANLKPLRHKELRVWE